MGPANTVHYELVDLLLTVLKEASIVFTVEVLFLLGPALLLCLTFSEPVFIILLYVFIDRGQDSNHTLEEEKDVVEAVDFKLFEECTSQIPLVLVPMHELAVRIQPSQVFYYRDFFATIDLLVVLNELANNSIE